MDTQVIGQHISRRYNKDLENLFNQVLAMGGHVEEQLARALDSVRKTDPALAKEVVGLDRFINRQQINIDELCLRLLARQQPAAVDLRLIMSALHIVVDLERMGDEITKLARVVGDCCDTNCQSFPGYDHLVKLTMCAQDMLKITLDAFAHLDVKSALSILPKEAAADEEYRLAKKNIAEKMVENPDKIPQILELLNALRAMERVTDHALNIAEQVLYVVEGTDIRQISTERLAVIIEKYSDAE